MISDLKSERKHEHGMGITDGVTIRIPQELRERIDKFSSDHCLTRTTFFKEAAELLLNSKTCVFCGKRNLGDNDECVSCHRKLYSDEQLSEAIASLSKKKAEEHNLPYGDDNGYVYTYIPRISARRNGEIEYFLEAKLLLPNGSTAHIDNAFHIPITKDELLETIENSNSK